MLVAIFSVNFYVFYRIWNVMPTNGLFSKTVIIATAILLVFSIFAGLAGGNVLPVPLVTFLYRLGTSWFFICLYLLMIFVLIDILRLTHLFPIEKYVFGNWFAFGVMASLITLVMTWGYFRYQDKERVELHITINKEMGLQTPLKIVAISDLHLGFAIGKNEFEQWIELINKENPDIVLIAGDIIDNNTKVLEKQNIAASFRKIKSKYGVYAALGNHEYIGNISKSLDFLHRAGITVLQDSAALVDACFYVVGRDDRSNSKRKTIEELTATLDKSKPIFLIDHQPYHLEEAAKNEIDFQLSGHTHRGQVFPISLITDKMYEKSHGYIQKENTHIYVTSGLGIWGGKFRIGSRSEYVVIMVND